MSRRDPTLPSPDTATLPEADLIARVKTDRDSAALVALVNRHTGIYFSVVNRYAAAYPSVIKTHDMDDEKLFHLDAFICAYDPTRGTKLSTYIRDRTDYLCKGVLKRDARNPLSFASYTASGQAPLDTSDDTFSTSNGGEVTLQDESATARVTDAANLDIAIEDIRRAAGVVCADHRFIQILEYRHLGTQTSWRAIAEKVGVSHEGCRKIYFHNLELVKSHLAGKSR